MNNTADVSKDLKGMPFAGSETGAGDVPAHSIRRSKRARRIGLRVLPGKGLEVVLPLHADPACVPAILNKYDAWIRRALERMCDQSPGPDMSAGTLPDSFLIKGGEELVLLFSRPESPLWSAGLTEQAERQKAGGSMAGAEAAVVAGAKGSVRPSFTRPPLVRRARLFPEDFRERPGFSHEKALARLREWVREEAREYLGDMLAGLAAAHGFSYSRLSVRFQKTRWGSCSAKGTINLNGCLLFLPEAQTRYILLHELCHTRQLNHSERFWKILFSCEPEALALDKAMRRIWRYVPQWVFGQS